MDTKRIWIGLFAIGAFLFVSFTDTSYADSGAIGSLPQIIYTENPLPSGYEEVFFKKGGTDFVDPKEASEILDVQAAVFLKFKSFTINIIGYTDDREVGSLDESLALGRRRAQTIFQNLVSRGIDSARLRISSRGYQAFLFIRHDEKALAGSRFVWTAPDIPPPDSR